MNKFLAMMLAFVLVMSFCAMAFAASSPSKTDVNAAHGDAAGSLIVKFSTGEIRVATPIVAPYGEEGDAAVALADKVVKSADDADEELKAFFEANKDNLAEGIITLGEDAAEGSITLAVSAKGFDKVMFTAPGDADNLGFVVING